MKPSKNRGNDLFRRAKQDRKRKLPKQAIFPAGVVVHVGYGCAMRSLNQCLANRALPEIMLEKPGSWLS
jgi:hypothetical protein